MKSTIQGSRQSPLPSLTVGLLKSTEAKSEARAQARARLRFNRFQDVDGALVNNPDPPPGSEIADGCPVPRRSGAQAG
jgi:hypothetical protein